MEPKSETETAFSDQKPKYATDINEMAWWVQ